MQLLKSSFYAGDDGGSEKCEIPGFMKESENIFTLWCSGRTCCEGMLVELKLIKVSHVICCIRYLQGHFNTLILQLTVAANF